MTASHESHDAPTPDVSDAPDAPSSPVEPIDATATASPDSPSTPPPRRKRRGKRWAISLLTVLLVAVAALVTVSFVLSPPSALTQEVEFEVLPGWGGNRVASELHDAGLVRSAFAFQLYLRYSGLDTRLGEGLYDLRPNMGSREIAAALAAGGRPRTVLVVVPEGWRARAVIERLAANGLGALANLEQLIREPGELTPAYVPRSATLEGYLFPASYDVPVRSSAEEALGVMVERFESELTDEIAELLLERDLTVHQWVTLASMVQAEAASDDEMPLIAGVFLNRLELGMLLQSDPTAAYGLGKPLPELRAADLRKDTPWNTYTRDGLPFGPIANPGRSALHAVLEPLRVNEAGEEYLYFLHGTDGGEPVFRPNTNLAAHNRDVVRFLRNDGRP